MASGRGGSSRKPGGRRALEPHLPAVIDYRLGQRAPTDGERRRIVAVRGALDVDREAR